MARKARDASLPGVAGEGGGAPARAGSPPREEGAGDTRFLRTAEVLERTGITHQVLYRYITLGLIEAARTTETGVRLFHPDTVRLIEIVKELNQTGYSLRDMKDIFFKDARVRKIMSRG
jgi:hypothetical protein